MSCSTCGLSKNYSNRVIGALNTKSQLLNIRSSTHPYSPNPSQDFLCNDKEFGALFLLRNSLNDFYEQSA